MSEIQIAISVFLITLGIFFMFVGSVGILRLPDFYSRTHTISKGDTLGIFMVIIGLIVYEGFTQSSLKLLLIVFFIALSNPVGSHALAKAAFTKGLKPFLSENDEEADRR
jgi:multicomponent Na+:H+ antiporter subunit G